MKPTLLHRLTSLTLVFALMGSTYPAPLLAQQLADTEPAPISTDRPLSLPPAGPQPDAKLLREQEQMLAEKPPVPSAVSSPVIAPPLVQLPIFPKFSDPPTDAEIAMIQVLDDAPFPFGPEKPGVNAAFVKTLEKWWSSPRQVRDLALFEEFLSAQRGSRWAVALRRQMARTYHRDGFFTRTLAATERAWQDARSTTTSPQRQIADGIAADLAELYAQLGRKAELASLAEATRDREMSDHHESRIRHASLRFGAESLTGRKSSQTCGATALMRVLAELQPNAPEAKIFSDSALRTSLGLVPGPDGYSLRDLSALADAAGLPMRPVRRELPAPVAGKPAPRMLEWPVPSVVHWTHGHYSALIKRIGSQYLVSDLSMGGDRYVTEAALKEASGYALVEDKPLPKGLRALAPDEAGKVFGTQGGAPV